MTLQNVVSQAYAISSGWVNPPGNAFDGGTVTNWATSTETIGHASGVDWIGQDFGTPKNIVQVTIAQLSAPTAITSVKVQYSDDLSGWTDVGTYPISKDAAINTINFASVGSHRAWRLLANGNPTGSERWQVTEVTMSVPAGTETTIRPPRFTAYPQDAFPLTPSASLNARGIANATTIVPCNVKWRDSNGCYDDQLYRFTPNVPGDYEFKAFLQVNGDVTGKIHIHICKNGEPFVFPAFPALAGCWGYAVEIPMNGTTDYVDVRVQVEGGSNIKIGGDYGDWSWFEGHFIG